MKNIFKAVGWVALTFLTQIIAQFIIGIVIAVTVTTEEPLYSETLMGNTFLSTLIANLILVLIASIIYKCKKITIKDEWKLNKANVKDYIIPCIITFTYSVAFSFITYDPITASKSVTYISADYYGNMGIPMMILALLISAPITEEIINRGIIMNTLKRSFSARNSIIISAVIFGALHFLAGGITLAIGATLIGVIFAIIYEKTNSLWVAVVSHTIANLPDFILYPRFEIPNVLRITIAIISIFISITLLILYIKPKKI